MSYSKAVLSSKSYSSFLFIVGLLHVIFTNSLQAQSLSATEQFHERYAQISLDLRGDPAIKELLSKLLQEAESYRDANPVNAEALIASARIRVGYANALGVRGLGRLKTSRNELEQAISLNENAKDGFAQALLGYLYAGVPRWPMSFQDREKAITLLEEALNINDASMANNLFYSIYLVGTNHRFFSYENEQRWFITDVQSSPQWGQPWLVFDDLTTGTVLSNSVGEEVPKVPVREYGSAHRDIIGEDIRLPEDIDQLFNLYFELDSGRKEDFHTACTLYNQALELTFHKASLSLVAAVMAIEALVDGNKGY